jgi:outer membrane protein assembly factor BamE (lipoprotein component of BamABCDE complex)
MKLVYKALLLIIALSSCTKINELHGIDNLKNKANNLVINQSNSNDVLNVIGPPQHKDVVNKNIWFYNEVRHTQTKLGSKEIVENNILKIEFDDLGVLKELTFLDKRNMEKIIFSKEKTETLYRSDSTLQNFLSTVKERVKNFGKTSEQ